MKRLIKIEEAVIALGLLFVTVLLFVNIVLRYGFAANTTWAQEFIRYVMIWITFIGAGVCFRKGLHLGVDFLMDLLKGKAKKGLQIFVNLISIAFMLLLIKYGIDMVIFTKGTGQITPSLQVPIFYIYLAIPIGSALSVLHLIFNLIEIFQNKQTFPEKLEE
ncbi:TRAP transporter small permease [Virgibacillus necropolis]|uniref:TRAP transporter permease DctQ n=1 Tax=Virgibacillus necropolis TaxID=163877 RepID=A0A221MEX4_9BACI|nr:TRAP transporter small permease [Virgibacillus necropolis]ASN06207.1 TRAP transporter permease DctQ [Virgibacillus necropolis]